MSIQRTEDDDPATAVPARPPPGSRGPTRLALSRAAVMIAAAACIIAIFHTVGGRGGRPAPRDGRDGGASPTPSKALRRARGDLPEALPRPPAPPPGPSPSAWKRRPAWARDGPPPWSIPAAPTSPAAPPAVDPPQVAPPPVAPTATAPAGGGG